MQPMDTLEHILEQVCWKRHLMMFGSETEHGTSSIAGVLESFALHTSFLLTHDAILLQRLVSIRIGP